MHAGHFLLKEMNTFLSLSLRANKFSFFCLFFFFFLYIYALSTKQLFILYSQVPPLIGAGLSVLNTCSHLSMHTRPGHLVCIPIGDDGGKLDIVELLPHKSAAVLLPDQPVWSEESGVEVHSPWRTD